MANLFPMEETPVIEEEEVSTDVDFGRSWRFDYEAGDFVLTPTGKVAEADGRQAWIEWCKKALQTVRYQHLIYSRDHGQEFDDLMRMELSRSATESEIQRITTETLMVDPRTSTVGNFVFTWYGDRCFFTCEIENVREETGEIEGVVIV